MRVLDEIKTCTEKVGLIKRVCELLDLNSEMDFFVSWGK